MKHLIDEIDERPYLCEDCKHFINGITCRTFDIIPLNVLENPEGHTSVIPDQNGDYVFETDKPRDTMRVYREGGDEPAE